MPQQQPTIDQIIDRSKTKCRKLLAQLKEERAKAKLQEAQAEKEKKKVEEPAPIKKAV